MLSAVEEAMRYLQRDGDIAIIGTQSQHTCVLTYKHIFRIRIYTGQHTYTHAYIHKCYIDRLVADGANTSIMRRDLIRERISKEVRGPWAVKTHDYMNLLHNTSYTTLHRRGT